ncbi:MAG: nuclear transport factor 2 family protein [Acidobacteriota bacterium]
MKRLNLWNSQFRRSIPELKNYHLRISKDGEIMKKPGQILSEWIEAVNKRDIDNILSFYNRNAVLIPTFSNRILDTPAKIRDYFERLGSNDELKVTLHENTMKVLKVSETVFALSGIYLWRLSVEGETLNFEARFSFVLDLNLQDPVIQHHSSQIPRML